MLKFHIRNYAIQPSLAQNINNLLGFWFKKWQRSQNCFSVSVVTKIISIKEVLK